VSGDRPPPFVISRNYAARQHPAARSIRGPSQRDVRISSLHRSGEILTGTGMSIGSLHAITNPPTKPSGQLAHFRVTFDMLADRLNLANRSRREYNTGRLDESKPSSGGPCGLDGLASLRKEREREKRRAAREKFHVSSSRASTQRRVFRSDNKGDNDCPRTRALSGRDNLSHQRIYGYRKCDEGVNCIS
jgi:hypothetical protein